MTLPRVDAIAAKDAAGTLWLSITNLDPNEADRRVCAHRRHQRQVRDGRDADCPAVDSVNTFEAPKTVAPKPVSAKIQGGQLTLTLEPKSVTLVAVR